MNARKEAAAAKQRTAAPLLRTEFDPSPAPAPVLALVPAPSTAPSPAPAPNSIIHNGYSSDLMTDGVAVLSGLSRVYVIPNHIAQLTDEELDFVFQKQPGASFFIIYTTKHNSYILLSPHQPHAFSDIPSPTSRPIVPVKLDATEKASRSKKSLAKSFDCVDSTVVFDVSSSAESPDISPPVAKISLRIVLKSAPHNWTFEKIPRDGHCLFHSFVLALNNLNIPSCPKTYRELREACAKQLSEWNGFIPGLREQLFQEGKVLYQDIRGEKERLITLKEYCSLLRRNMYGGLEEIQLMVQMYKVQVFVYSSSVGTTSENPYPLPVLMNNDFPPDHEKNAGNTVAVNCLQIISHCVIQVRKFTCFWNSAEQKVGVIIPPSCVINIPAMLSACSVH